MAFIPIVRNTMSAVDAGWAYEVQKHAAFVWIRLVGINHRTGIIYFPTDQPVEHWVETAAKMRVRANAAYLWLTTGMYGKHRPIGSDLGRSWDFRIVNSDTCRAKWHEIDPHMGDRLRGVMLELRRTIPWPIGIFAEDFSARWLAASGVIPDLLVLDNPMLSRDEYAASKLPRVPGLIRSSYWGVMQTYDDWGPCPEADLLTGDPTTRRHGEWHHSDGVRI